MLALGGAAPRDLLPDLDPAAPSRLSVASRGGTTWLTFRAAIANVGTGPLLVEGRRATRRERDMRVVQRVRRSDGSRRWSRVLGVIRYVRSPDHEHWHYLRFVRYAIRRADGEPAAAPDRKTGFCLGDRYRVHGFDRARPRRAVLTGECGKNRPGLLRVREGISVGYGDDYKPSLEGQELELTGLRAGEYVLVHRVNASRALAESDYRNNASSLRFELSWRAGRAAVRIIARCAASDRCR